MYLLNSATNVVIFYELVYEGSSSIIHHEVNPSSNVQSSSVRQASKDKDKEPGTNTRRKEGRKNKLLEGAGIDVGEDVGKFIRALLNVKGILRAFIEGSLDEHVIPASEIVLFVESSEAVVVLGVEGL